MHFVALVNVLSFKPGGLGALGDDQIAWLENDLKGRSASTPIIVFAHMPLWTIYEPWGWGTGDAEQAFALMRRFGSVTLLNGHIHQIVSKVEGNMTFHTARSTAYPQPSAGVGAGPGPLKVEAAVLPKMLGITSIAYAKHPCGGDADRRDHRLSFSTRRVTMIPRMMTAALLASRRLLCRRDGTDALAADAPNTIVMKNFDFAPMAMTVNAGTTVTWRNMDEEPHTVVSTDGLFRSAALDTKETFTFKFAKAGRATSTSARSIRRWWGRSR